MKFNCPRDSYRGGHGKTRAVTKKGSRASRLKLPCVQRSRANRRQLRQASCQQIPLSKCPHRSYANLRIHHPHPHKEAHSKLSPTYQVHSQYRSPISNHSSCDLCAALFQPWRHNTSKKITIIDAPTCRTSTKLHDESQHAVSKVPDPAKVPSTQ